MMFEAAFWSSVVLIFYAYLGYPCALAALSLIRRRPVKRAPITPHVSFIITAYNEQARIREKIENTLRQNYPRSRFEILVASDCSTDSTDAIAASYSPLVRLIRAPHRKGKEAAQKRAIKIASGEILIFSDVATALEPDGIGKIVENFADPTVGCVSSVDRFVDADGEISGEGLYVRYEMWLRMLETKVNSLVGLSGSFFAARHEVCRRWATNRQSDFSTLLNAVDMGWRGVLDPESAGYYWNITDDRREFERKVRTVVRGLFVLTANAGMMNPLRYGLFAWQLASHKLCRWVVPFAMLTAFASNAVLAPQSAFYLMAFLAQTGWYLAALAGLYINAGVLKVPAFLLAANVAVFVAWMRHAAGDRITAWTPSERMRALPRLK
jgi:glycosyltransferase involved in cell wall biosynthesis